MAWIPPELRGRVFAVAATLTAVLLGVQIMLDRALAPHGIVTLELAGIPERAAMILLGWGAAGSVAAAFGLGLDYLFALAYAATLAMACEALSGLRGGLWSRVGIVLAWGALAAGTFDLVENSAMAVMLLRGDLAPWAVVAATCATLKFLLVAMALLYVVTGVVVSATGR